MPTHKKILIVEDDEVISYLEKSLLELEGFQVEVANDGAEGLEKIKQNEYDVILCNIEMPRMRGDELYLEVRKLSQDLANKIIFVSGTISPFLRSTGNPFLVKPFLPAELIQAVKTFLRLP